MLKRLYIWGILQWPGNQKSCPGRNNETWLGMNVKEKHMNVRIKSMTLKNKVTFNLQSTRKESMKGPKM